MIALCSVVAVVAMLATEANHPYSSSNPHAATRPGYDTKTSDTLTDDPAPSDVPSNEATNEATTNSADGQPAPQPAPPVEATAVRNPSVPVPTTPRPIPVPSPIPPPGPVYYEAESSANTLTRTRTFSCSPCSGGKKIGNIGTVGWPPGVIQFNGVQWGNGGAVLVVVSYLNGDDWSRTADFSLNNGTVVTLTFPPTGSWNTVRTLTLKLTFKPGANQLMFTNPSEPGPDLDMITVRSP